MKKYCFFVSIIFSALVSCTEDMKYKDGEVVAPQGMTLPQNGYFLQLRSGAGVSTYFQWLSGKAQDGYPLQYEIVFFDQQTGGKEVERIDAGFNTSAQVSHKALNRIAGAVNNAPGAETSLYWGVAAARGIQTAMSDTRYKLDVKRLYGFTFIPERLYLLGTGVEGGTTADNALAFRTTGDGEYEIYAKFTAGNFVITDNPASQEHKYAFSGSLAAEAAAPQDAPAEGIYRIRLDFNTKAVTSEKITKVVFYPRYKKGGGNTFSDREYEMSYNGKGTWIINDLLIQMNDWNANLPDGTPNADYDDRYIFRAYYGTVMEDWGSTVNEIRVGAATDPSKAYFNVGSANLFKNDATVWFHTCDVVVDMNGAAQPYHYYVVKE